MSKNIFLMLISKLLVVPVRIQFSVNIFNGVISLDPKVF
jgi:hypothetical protein